LTVQQRSGANSPGPMKSASAVAAARQKWRQTATVVRTSRAAAWRKSGGAAAGACCQRLAHMMCGPVLHPDARFRTSWNAVLALLICYCGVAIPLEIAFEDDLILHWCTDELAMGEALLSVEGGSGRLWTIRRECTTYQVWFWGNVVVDIWFILDMIVNLRTGYTVEGHFVQDDWKAVKRYLSGSFIFDLIGSFPINLVLLPLQDGQDDDSATFGRTNKMLRLLRMAKLTKLTRMLKLSKYLEYVEVVIKFNPAVVRIVKLCMIIILTCHWFGCIWWLVSDLEMSSGVELASPWYTGENNWHPPIWLKRASPFDVKYWHAFFWGAGMCLGMVPRDIEPVTSLEAIVTTFTMFIGLLLAAFVISSFTSAYQQMDQKAALAGKQLDLIRNYLLLKAVPTELRSRILEFYQYIFTASTAAMDDLQLILQHMPPNLATQLALSTNSKLVSRTAFLREMCDGAIIVIVSSLSPMVFVPGQRLCTGGQPLRCIFFINRGKVELSQGGVAGAKEVGPEAAKAEGTGIRDDASTEQVVKLLGESDSIGLDEFISSSPSRYSARALTYCDVMLLSLRHLQAAMDFDATERLRLAKLAAAELPSGGSKGAGAVKDKFRRAGRLALLAASKTMTTSSSSRKRLSRELDNSMAPVDAELTPTESPPCTARGSPRSHSIGDVVAEPEGSFGRVPAPGDDSES